MQALLLAYLRSMCVTTVTVASHVKEDKVLDSRLEHIAVREEWWSTMRSREIYRSRLLSDLTLCMYDYVEFEKLTKVW